MHRYARKRIYSPAGHQGIDIETQIEYEAKQLRTLKGYPHIVELAAQYIRGQWLGLLMRPVADCNLMDFLSQSIKDLPSKEAQRSRTNKLLQILGYLAKTLVSMYSKYIRHKDISRKNNLVRGIVLKEEFNVLFTDFGSSFDFSSAGRSTTEGKPGPATKKYVAPEVAEWEGRGTKSDVFSLGRVFLEIASVLLGYGLENSLGDPGSKRCTSLCGLPRWHHSLSRGDGQEI
ncbi:MAG: hypothetical protein M1827_005744 [Pycnora praestabilis]|nr:MAG: hypothetical protein M1827_005744 [Pycnora praestabilis]